MFQVTLHGFSIGGDLKDHEFELENFVNLGGWQRDFWTMTVGSVSYLSVVCPVFCLGRIQRPGGYRGHSNRPYFGPGCLITANIPTHTMACKVSTPSWNFTPPLRPTQWDPLLHKWDPQNCGEVFQINGCDMELLASQMEPPESWSLQMNEWWWYGTPCYTNGTPQMCTGSSDISSMGAKLGASC